MCETPPPQEQTTVGRQPDRRRTIRSRSHLGATYLVEPEPVDDHWDLPDDLYDWTDDADTADERNAPLPVPDDISGLDRPDEPEFRHDEDTYWFALSHATL